MEEVCERENLKAALRRVKDNKGSPGVDGMTVNELPDYLKQHWPTIREQFLNGTYKPQPVRRFVRQWKTPRRRRAELMARGVPERRSSNTASCGYGPWRVIRTRALTTGLSNAYFQSLGLPPLVAE